MFSNTPGNVGPDPLVEGIDCQPVQEEPITTRGLYSDAHAEILVELEAIDRDIQHHRAGGNQPAVSRLRILESHSIDRLAKLKLDAIADMCFGARSAILVNDHSLRDCLSELLIGRVASKTDLDEIKASLKFVFDMIRRNP